ILAKRYQEAIDLLSRLRAAHPSDQRLAVLGSAAAALGQSGPAPAWAATPDAFAAALASADPEPLLAGTIQYRASSEHGIDLFLAAGFEPGIGPGFGFIGDGVTMLALRYPRVSHCVPAGCFSELAVGLEAKMGSALWSRPVHLPLGDGYEGLFRVPVGLLMFTVVPIGGQVYGMVVSGPP